jgi:hypothetical protein
MSDIKTMEIKSISVCREQPASVFVKNWARNLKSVQHLSSLSVMLTVNLILTSEVNYFDV